MSLVSQISTLATRMGTEAKALRTLINGNAVDLSSLTTTTKTTVVAAINEVNAKPSGGATALSGLTDVSITSVANTQVLRYNSTTSKWENVNPLTYFEVAGAAAAAQAASQPLDSDLTAIAALTTTAYGRAFLALVDQNALMALVPQATTSVLGKVQLATNAITVTGTDTAMATTSAGTKAAIDARIDNSALGTSTTNAPSAAAVKAYADALIAANDAMVYKGVINASTNPNYPAADAGWTYKISVAGKIGGASGPNVEVGDIIMCTVDGTASGTQATVGANWNITQTNIDGAVVGPASAVSADFATFSGTSGKVVQDSGISLDTDSAFTANSDLRIPSQKAVNTAVALKQPLDATLTAIAALVTTANSMIYATGADTFSQTSLTAYGRTLMGLADAAAGRAALAVYSTTEVGDPTTDFVAVFNAALV